MTTPRRRGGPLFLTAFAAIFAVGLALRLWKMRWGLGAGMAFTDELQMWPSYLGAFVPLSWRSFLRSDTPGALIYPTFYGFVSGGIAALAHALGLIGPPKTDVFRALVIARGISAVAGSLNVIAVGALGCRFYSKETGLLAAAFMAVVPLDAMHAHYASVDPLLELWIAITLLASCELIQRGTIFVALVAGAAGGLAFGTKYTGLIAGGAIAWAVLEVARRERSVACVLRLGGAALAGFLVAVAASCPPCILQSGLMLQAMQFHSATSTFENLLFWRRPLVPTLGWYGRPYLYQLVAGMPFSLGWPLYLTALAGVVQACRRRTPTDRLLLVTLAAYFLTIGTSIVLEVRYYIPMFPALVVLGAAALVTLPWRGVAAALAASVLLYTGALAVSQVGRFSYRQQHQVADWIRTAVPARSASVRVAIPQGMDPYYNLRQPLVWAGLTPVPLPVERWLEEPAVAFVMPDWLAIRIRRNEPDGPAARMLDRLESGQGGYVAAARWESRYLQSDLYTTLDPAFAADLVQGEIGFTVYVPSSSPAPVRPDGGTTAPVH
ncbi:MAG: phospholipid carrier-dependent glycosyltransferase [Deltaproteobacteria bacterium]|nr:phospholipid carrier-dependent glycosyltransferase [Deltaproteobacteria bacterium]